MKLYLHRWACLVKETYNDTSYTPHITNVNYTNNKKYIFIGCYNLYWVQYRKQNVGTPQAKMHCA